MAVDLPSPNPLDRQTIVCLYCNKPQEVGRKAMTITCRFCHKALRLEDTRIKTYEARRSIETVGVITVEKKGSVVTDTILCGGLIVRGKVKGKIISRGTIFMSPEGEIVGDVTAPSMVVPAGAILNGHYEIGVKD